ncbi:auxin-responsive IAA26-like [Olea europaea subsp. europaea]|uniref:Auxin-responsive protein n=1 Tax=Olea europaea subsp. europaea TaxID=158383 RepID=A0A8S0PZI6_OLEEU|nr:auxin-responsive IAA26-like [Olea europaea subsp. europaea]
MEGYSRKDGGCPQLLDLIPTEKEWLTKSGEIKETSHGSSEEKQLELRLGPPNGDWTIKNNDTVRYFSPRSSSSGYQVKSQQQTTPFLQAHGQLKESSQPNCTRAEKKTFSAANTAVPNSSSAQKRTAPTPVVGWPPIRSFRKNLASGSSSKAGSESQNVVGSKISSEKATQNSPKSLLVKINMDGVPIGRKVDLKEHDSYEKLSSAVDELFRGLLAAQSNFSTGGIKNEEDGGKAITGLLDGSGEYTLVYEDNEGDRLLIGDVPWHMFVSSVKRLRVLKSSELPTLCREFYFVRPCLLC